MLARLLPLIALLGIVGVTAPVAAENPSSPSKTYLGILAEPAPANAAKPGIMVREVTPDSPADKAGLKRGDQIVKIGNQEVKTFDDLVNALAKQKAGDKVAIQAVRDGKEQSLMVTLAERKASAVPFLRAAAFLGVQTQPLTAADRSRLGVAVDVGALVTDVVPGSPAATAGIQCDDVVTSFDSKPVAQPEDLREAVHEAGVGKAIPFTVARGKETKQLQVTLEESPGGISLPPLPGERGALRRMERRLEQLEKRVQELEQKLNQRPPR